MYDILKTKVDLMEREKARNKTINLLLGQQNSQSEFYKSIFTKYNYGESTPVSPIYMNNVNSKHNIVITEEAYKKLIQIRKITEQTNLEIAYFIFGEEKPNGTAWLDTVISTYKPSSRIEANFNDIKDKLELYINQIQNGKYYNKQIVCHGHTHGKTFASDNFSLGDLISYVQFTNLHTLFKTRQIETIGMLMPPNGDFNFIIY